MRANTHTHTLSLTHACMHTHTHGAHTYTHTYSAPTYAHAHARTYVHTHACTPPHPPRRWPSTSTTPLTRPISAKSRRRSARGTWAGRRGDAVRASRMLACGRLGRAPSGLALQASRAPTLQTLCPLQGTSCSRCLNLPRLGSRCLSLPCAAHATARPPALPPQGKPITSVPTLTPSPPCAPPCTPGLVRPRGGLR